MRGNWRKQFSDVPPRSCIFRPRGPAGVAAVRLLLAAADVARVIFVSTPHLGSGLARRIPSPVFSRISSACPPPRSSIRNSASKSLQAVAMMPRASLSPRPIASFPPGQVAPAQACLKLPLSDKVYIHSLIGDRGRATLPRSSDGVVPYWSSTSTSREVRKIVPSGRGAGIRTPKASGKSAASSGKISPPPVDSAGRFACHCGIA